MAQTFGNRYYSREYTNTDQYFGIQETSDSHTRVNILDLNLLPPVSPNLINSIKLFLAQYHSTFGELSNLASVPLYVFKSP